MSRLSFLVFSLLLLIIQSVFAGTNPNREFSVDRTEVFTGVLVTFDASNIKPAKKFIFSLGNGETVTSTHPVLSYQYTRAGSYTASLTYQVNASEKNPNYKSAGSVVITVKDATPKPNIAPTANISCSVNYQLVSCSGLASYDPENQPLTYTFDYEDGFTETNTTGLSSHAYALPGLFNVRLSVYDSAGASGVASTLVQAVKPPNKLPVLALNCSSSQINTLTCDAVGSADSDGSIFSYSYAWDDGTSESKADASDVTHGFTTSGSHFVTLTAVDNEGGVSSITKNFEVKANTNPMANFDCDASKPLKLDCTSTSIDADAEDAIQTYSWKFGSNTAYSTTTSTTDYSFQSGGEVTVTHEVKDSFGGTSSLTKTFTVKENQLPSFDFKADVLRGIAPFKVHFQLENILDIDGTITSTEINFGDETTSGANDVFHDFQSPGTYNVLASVTDDMGGTTTKTIQIVAEALIENPPQAYFKIFQFETKVELHATLTKTQYEIKTAFYTIDGSETVELIEFYPNTVNWVDLKNYGHHEIKLTVEDIYGQQSTFNHSFELGENLDSLKPYTDFVVKQSAVRTVFINLNRSFDFDIDQPIQSFRIDLGNGQTIDTSELYVTYSYPVSGTYPITVTSFSSHGTQSSVTKEFTVTDEDTPILSPTANFGYRIYDFAQNVSFYNERSGTPNGEIISYIWDFGDNTVGTGQKVSHFYNPGSYLVTLTVVDSAGLQSSQTQHVTIFGTGSDLIAQIDCNVAEPYFDFTQTCQIMALDKLNQISRVRVTWGDGTASVLPLNSPNGIFKPAHKYLAAGNYPVNLTVTTTRGEVKTAATTLNLTKYTPVIADIQCTTNNMFVSCNALGSYDILGRPLSYTFDYGDSFVDINESGVSSHAYSIAGTYLVKVTVQNTAGEMSSASTLVMPVVPLNILPYPRLSCDATSPLYLKCNAIGSLDSDGYIASFIVEWGDGSSETFGSAESELVHLYSAEGNYSVSLTAVDDDGGISKEVFSFNVLKNNPPVAMLSCQSLNAHVVHCDSYSYDNDPLDTITVYDWDMGNGIKISTLIPSVDYTYDLYGSYEIKLSVKDSYGISSEASQNVVVKENIRPVANLNCFNTTGDSYQCDANASDIDGSIVSQQWTIDNQAFSGGSILYNFSAGGDYVVKLLIKDDLGASSEYSTTITIHKPMGDFNCSEIGPLKLECTASNVSDYDGRKILTTRFEFDQEGVIESNNAIFTFSTFGVHEIRFYIMNDIGAEAVIRKQFNMQKKYFSPLAQFSSTMHLEKKVAFNAEESQFQEREVAVFEWDFGDGTQKTSESFLVEHFYLNNGFFDVKLTVTDRLGVKNIITKRIYVHDPVVDDPGPAGLLGLSGVDSDNDGVRDDIQRWIAAKALDNSDLKLALHALGKNYQEAFSKISLPDDLFLLMKKREKIQLCLQTKYTSLDDYEQTIFESEMLNANTDARIKASFQADAVLNGEISETNSVQNISEICKDL